MRDNCDTSAGTVPAGRDDGPVTVENRAMQGENGAAWCLGFGQMFGQDRGQVHRTTPTRPRGGFVGQSVAGRKTGG